MNHSDKQRVVKNRTIEGRAAKKRETQQAARASVVALVSGVALAAFGLPAARAQTYSYTGGSGTANSPAGVGYFSTGFTPTLTTGSSTATLSFGGTHIDSYGVSGYQVVDDLANSVSLNSLSFTNSGSTVLYTGGASNTLNFNGPACSIDMGRSGGPVSIYLNMTLGLHGINVIGNPSLSSQNSSFSGVLSGSGFVDYNGAGSLFLGNQANTYTGGTFFEGGTIEINSDGSLGTVPSVASSNLEFNGGTLDFVNLYGTTLNANRNITLEGGYADHGGTFTGSATIAGSISGSGALTVAAGSSSRLSLTGNNTYTGRTIIGGGTSLQIGSGGTTGTLGTGAVVDNGNLLFNRTGGLTVANAISGTGSVVETTGYLSLTGANTYTGGTTVSGGTLVLTTDGNLGAVPATAATNLTLASGTTLELGGDGIELNANRGVALTGGGTVTVDIDYNHTTAIDGVISGSGGLNVSTNGGGSLTLSGANTYAGGTTVTGTPFYGATLAITSDANLGAAPSSPATNLTLNNATLQLNNNAGVVQLNADRNLVLTGNDTLSAGSGSFLLIDGALSGSGNLTVAGAGQVELNGNNTGSGTTTINAGSVLGLGDSGVANGGTAGAVASGNVIDNGGLRFGRADTYTVANAISGTGVVVESAAGTTILTSAANTYSGGTDVYYGTLRLGAAAADGTGSLLVSGAHSVVQLDVSHALGGGDIMLADGGTIVDATGSNGGGGMGGNAAPGLHPNDAPSGAQFTGLGKLNVGNGTSFLDYGASNAGATFSFSSAGSFDGTLQILDWTDAPGADGGADNLYFGSGPGTLTPDQLADITFVNPDGMMGTYGAQQGSDGSLFASTTLTGSAAAPEPGTIALLALGLASGLPAIGTITRRRMAR